MNPAFFREDRPHLRELAETLQALEEGTLKAPDGSVCRRLAISEPPRHGKSYTMTLFNQWCFGRNPQDRIINVSYNELLSGRFSKGVRTASTPRRSIHKNALAYTGNWIGYLRLQQQFGIAPARAGKSRWHYGPVPSYRDQPRTCGEKGMLRVLSSGERGSPPRMRGKAVA